MLNDNKNILGIIGGIGPLATINTVNLIINNTDAGCDQEHIPMIIYSDTKIPDRTKYLCENGENPLFALMNDVKFLEKAGVKYIIIPCNTAHYFINELQNGTDVPIINMAEETCKYIANMYKGYQVTVLGTNGLKKGEVYNKYLTKYGITAQSIDNHRQNAIMNIITDLKAGGSIEMNFKSLKTIMESLYKNDCRTFLIACTELSMLASHFSKEKFNIVDAGEVLAIRTIQKLGYKVKNVSNIDPNILALNSTIN